MRLNVFKPGWQQPVGSGEGSSASELVGLEDYSYRRVELKNFLFSHAAGLFLLQGATLEQLFADVVLTVGDEAPDAYSLIFAAPPQLHRPPPQVACVVLAHIFERPAHATPQELLRDLFLSEVERRGSIF